MMFVYWKNKRRKMMQISFQVLLASNIREISLLYGAPRVFSWRLKIGQIWGILKTEDLKIQL